MQESTWKYNGASHAEYSSRPVPSPLGLEVGVMSDVLCNPHVIVTDVAYKSLAHINGVKAGDEVLKINDVPINSSNAWLAVVHLSQVNCVRLYLRRETTSNESVLLIVPLNCGIENMAKVLKPPHLQPSAVENVYSMGGVLPENILLPGGRRSPAIIPSLDSTQSPGPATSAQGAGKTADSCGVLQIQKWRNNH